MQNNKENFIFKLKKNWLFISISSFIIFLISLFLLLNINPINYQVNIPIKINFKKSLQNGINLNIVQNLEYYIQATQVLSNLTANEVFKSQNTKSVFSYNTNNKTFNIKLSSMKSISDEKIKEYISILDKKIDTKNDLLVKNTIENSELLSRIYKNSSNLSEAVFNSESLLFATYVKNLRINKAQLYLYKNNIVLNIFEVDHDTNLTNSNYFINKTITLATKIREELHLLLLKDLSTSSSIEKILEDTSIHYRNTIIELNKIKKTTEMLELFYIPNLSVIDDFNGKQSWSNSQLDLKFLLMPIIFILSISISFILFFIKDRLFPNR